MAERERKRDKIAKRGEEECIHPSGWTDQHSQVLPAKQHSRFVVRNGSKSDGRWGVKEHPGATFRYEKAFVSISPSSVSGFSLYLVLGLHF